MVTAFLAQAAYYRHLADFPVIPLLTAKMAMSLGLLVVQHFLWFRYFAYEWYAPVRILFFFVLCIWLVPLEIMVSLSANDNILPMSGPLPGPADDATTANKKSHNILLTIFGFLKRKKHDESNMMKFS
eukprot:TRINITY_DN2266_c0_g1_i1.p1 TRINITY_DN2266_c0_g1~~TRINITY_DN2266_c0_g1_i1.p1  ORF type:complete len:128 (+),score=20.81 TRINITY_DN2266_c0_g1_i1:273-656(+)